MKNQRYISTLSYTLLFTAATGLSFGLAHAKGKHQVDSFIQNAIEDTAANAETAEPEPMLTEGLLEAPELTQDDMAVTEPEAVETTPEPVAEEPALKTFMVTPSLTLMEHYDNNIFATETGEIDDWITTVKPGLDVKVKTDRIDLIAHAHYAHKFYADNTNEDHGDVSAGMNASLKLTEHVSMPVKIKYTDRHQQRYDNLTTTLPDSLLFTQKLKASAGLKFKSGRVMFLVKGAYSHEDFENGNVQNSTTAFIRSDSDRQSYKGLAKVAYDVNDMATIFAKGGYKHRDYDRLAFNGTSFTGQDRDSESHYAMAGLNLSYESVSALISVGYEDRDYQDTTINDHDDIIAKVKLTWHDENDATNISAHYMRKLYEDDDIITPITKNNFNLQATHKIDEKWMASAHADYDIYDFDGSTRQDDVISTGVGLDYVLTSYLKAGVSYEYMNRESDSANLDYDKHIAMVRLRGEMP